MTTLSIIKHRYQQFLEVVVVINLIFLAMVVIVGFTSRVFGSPFSWYDEVASISLAWLTYYGAALAASKGAHIACPSIVNMFPPKIRLPIVLIAEVITISFFVVLGYTGWQVVSILEGSTLISIPEVSMQLTQSVIPIASALFIIAELLALPEIIESARNKGFIDHELKDANINPEDAKAAVETKPHALARS